MNVAFVLTMPGCGSWNGRWSGEGQLYAVVRKFGDSQKTQAKLLALAGRSFSYSWPDGWRASIEVSTPTTKEARELRKNSKGFCGYEWMIESILARGKILADHEIPKETEAA